MALDEACGPSSSMSMSECSSNWGQLWEQLQLAALPNAYLKLPANVP